MGAISFWYFWTIWLRKKLKNLILKKSKISGVAQNGSISADWIFRVANFGFHYLRHFSIDIQNFCAHLTVNFLNFLKHPKHFILKRFLKGEKHKIQKSENMPFWAIQDIKPFLRMRFFNFFLNHMVQKYQNEIAPIFYYGKSPKTNEKDLQIPILWPLDWGQPYWMTLY